VRFEIGSAEAVPIESGTVDLVWCRDVLVHVRALDRAYAEFRRILRMGGQVLVYQVFGTDRLEPQEAARLWKAMGVVPTSAEPDHTDAAIAAAGLQVDECIDIGTEWGEWGEEQTGKAVASYSMRRASCATRNDTSHNSDSPRTTSCSETASGTSMA
jgi:SAM-dependent methyltransferase